LFSLFLLSFTLLVKNVSTGIRRSPWTKRKSPERDEMQVLAVAGQPEFEREEEEGLESNSGDSSYEE
jgi:hypothetical protein